MFLYLHNNADEGNCQGATEVLQDKSGTGRERPWRAKKVANQYLAAAYDEVDEKKAARLRDCATVLQFSILEDDTKKLKLMNSCRVRLCPMCGWRRELKVYHNTKAILDAMENDYAYLFLTLTVRNVAGADLAAELDKLMQAWQRFSQRKAVKTVVQGWYRGLEVTHNVNPLSPSFDTFHPHFHTLLAVPKRYFKGEDYLTKAEWAQLWKESLQVDYEPVVDVRRVKGSSAEAVAEAAKYSVKEADYLIMDDWQLTVDTVRILDAALNGRRFVAYGGAMKEWHKKLNLEDEEDGDLIHIDGEDSEAAPTSREETYFWNTGYQQYIKGDL